MNKKLCYFKGREAKKLFYQYWAPDSGKIKAFLVCLHGWGTHSDRFQIVADYLLEKGYALYAFDLRGHWRNDGDNPGHIDSMFEHIQKDIVLFMDVVKKEAGEKKIFLIGQGFGGLTALIYAIMHPQLEGVIACSPELALIEKISTKTTKYDINQKLLTSDLKILKQHNTDKNRIKIMTAKSASERIAAMKWAVKNASRLFCSSLIMQAGEDRITDKKKTKQFYEKAKSKDKKYIEYDGYYHELLHEKRRAQVYQDLFIWLEKHIK